MAGDDLEQALRYLVYFFVFPVTTAVHGFLLWENYLPVRLSLLSLQVQTELSFVMANAALYGVRQLGPAVHRHAPPCPA
jgi:hypothetical protein